MLKFWRELKKLLGLFCNFRLFGFLLVEVCSLCIVP